VWWKYWASKCFYAETVFQGEHEIIAVAASVTVGDLIRLD